MIRLKTPTAHACTPPMHEQHFYVPLGGSGLSPKADRYAPGALPASLRPLRKPHRTELVPTGDDGAVWQCGRCAAVWVIRSVAVYGPMTSRGKRYQAGLRLRWEKMGTLRAWRTRRKIRNSQTGG